MRRFKERVREITRRNRGISLKFMIEELSVFLRGWRAYFGFCQTPLVFGSLDSWVRRRLRAVQWKQWRRPQRRCAELLKRGVSFQYAAPTAASARGPWQLARSQAVQVALPNAYFDSLGLFRLAAH
jgi:RNA-directed DNA polymerase